MSNIEMTVYFFVFVCWLLSLYIAFSAGRNAGRNDWKGRQ